jgi:hypothetical protein
MALLLARVVVVVALKIEGAEEALDLEGGPSLALLPGTGLVGGVQPVGGLLEEEADDAGGGLEDGRPKEDLQLLDGGAVGWGGGKAGDQVGDLGLLGKEAAGVVFF